MFFQRLKKIKFTKKANSAGNAGFTLLELLVVIAIIGLLSSIIMASVNRARANARDSERVQTLKQFETALELYYYDHGKYPGWNNGGSDVYPGGNSDWGNTVGLQPDGTCSGFAGSSVKYDNSASIGFLDVLYNEGYITQGDWNDPLNPTLSPASNLPYNCRYIVPTTQRDANNVQRYYLHCRLETPSHISKNDGGGNPAMFEIQKPNPWLCALDF